MKAVMISIQPRVEYVEEQCKKIVDQLEAGK